MVLIERLHVRRVFSGGESVFTFPPSLRELSPSSRHSVDSDAVLYDLTPTPSIVLAAPCATAAQPSHFMMLRSTFIVVCWSRPFPRHYFDLVSLICKMPLAGGVLILV